MECIVCMDVFEDVYRIQCGSKVDHCLCHGCEVGWRVKMPLQNSGFPLQCPLCRTTETGLNPSQSRKSRTCEMVMLNVIIELIRQHEPVRIEHSEYILLSIASMDDSPVTATHNASFIERKWARLEMIHGARPDLITEVPPRPILTICDLLEPSPRNIRRPCESGKACPTPSRTQRQCRHPGCVKRVCRACHSCLAH
jgi:hypothetical protein